MTHSGPNLKPLIDLAKDINSSPAMNKAIVKSQKKGDSVLEGMASVGLYYEGFNFPNELEKYIGKNEVDISIWQSKYKDEENYTLFKIKAFLTLGHTENVLNY